MLHLSQDRIVRARPNVIICGAGIGGLALAIRLAELGFRPVVAEPRKAAALLSEGAFLTLAPNGMNGLKAIACYDPVCAAGVRTTGIEICNARGKRLAHVDQSAYERSFGAPSITIRRGTLIEFLMERAWSLGVDLRLGARIDDLSLSTDGVRIGLAHGGRIEADILVGADGLRSAVRSRIFPDYPQPHFTGLIGTGGIAPTALPSSHGTMRMTFGENAYFGYLIDTAQRAFWFSSFTADEPDITGDSPEALAERIRHLHARDPEPNRAILADVPEIDRTYPVFDMPVLPAWSKGRAVLLGDAAHAVGPHAGQGASMAIEDAIVLAACLDIETDHSSAFDRYERLRRPRIAQAARLTARNRVRKRVTGKVAVILRDLLLPIAIPLGLRMGRRLFRHRVDLTPLGSAPASVQDRQHATDGPGRSMAPPDRHQGDVG